MPELLQRLNYLVLRMAQGAYSRGTVAEVWAWVQDKLVRPPEPWRCLNVLLLFMQTFVHRNQFYLMDCGLDRAVEAVAQLLQHNTLEVRPPLVCLLGE